MFSKACEYGIRAGLYIAKESINGSRVNLKQISVAIGSPEAFTAKILQELARNRIVESRKGPNGGFYINPSRPVFLAELVTAIDGDVLFKGCGLGLSECSETRPCPLHDSFISVREQLRDMLEAATLQEMSKQLERGETFLKR